MCRLLFCSLPVIVCNFTIVFVSGKTKIILNLADYNKYIHSGDLYSASSRHYYSETLSAQLRPKKKKTWGKCTIWKGGSSARNTAQQGDHFMPMSLQPKRPFAARLLNGLEGPKAHPSQQIAAPDALPKPTLGIVLLHATVLKQSSKYANKSWIPARFCLTPLIKYVSLFFIRFPSLPFYRLHPRQNTEHTAARPRPTTLWTQSSIDRNCALSS